MCINNLQAKRWLDFNMFTTGMNFLRLGKAVSPLVGDLPGSWQPVRTKWTRANQVNEEKYLKPNKLKTKYIYLVLTLVFWLGAHKGVWQLVRWGNQYTLMSAK